LGIPLREVGGNLSHQRHGAVSRDEALDVFIVGLM
jgi:hypothetical protein